MSADQERPKRVAIFGGGIAGLSSFWLLNDHSKNEAELFEAESRLGGHANSVLFQRPGKKAAWVETAFVMFNPAGWPNFYKFLRNAGIPLHKSSGSYSVSSPTFGWASHSVWSLFGGSSGWFDVRPLRLIVDILRFNYIALSEIRPSTSDSTQPNREDGPTQEDHQSPSEGDTETVERWLVRRGFSEIFRDYYLIPLAGTIWSIPPSVILQQVPIKTIIEGLYATDLLKIWGRSQWYTIQGGSREYVKWIERRVGKDKIHLGVGVEEVIEGEEGVEVVLENGTRRTFDHVILATHSDISRRLLERGGSLRREDDEILGDCPWKQVEVIMHYDAALMPANRNIWAAWNNYITSDKGVQAETGHASTTFDMNLLHGLPISTYGRIFGSIHPPIQPDPAKVVARFQYTQRVLNVFTRPSEPPCSPDTRITGHDKKERVHRRVMLAGAWRGLGTHEDGLMSGIEAAEGLGARLPWEKMPRSPDVPEMGWVEWLLLVSEMIYVQVCYSYTKWNKG